MYNTAMAHVLESHHADDGTEIQTTRNTERILDEKEDGELFPHGSDAINFSCVVPDIEDLVQKKDAFDVEDWQREEAFLAELAAYDRPSVEIAPASATVCRFDSPRMAHSPESCPRVIGNVVRAKGGPIDVFLFRHGYADTDRKAAMLAGGDAFDDSPEIQRKRIRREEETSFEAIEIGKSMGKAAATFLAKRRRQQLPSSSSSPSDVQNMNMWFTHTSFGCMKSGKVAHFEPSLACSHLCVYVNGYVSPPARIQGQAISAADEDLIKAAKCKYAQLRRYADDMPPELHFSISTDMFQPDEAVQTKSLVVMEAWLEAGGLVSIVSKGVPVTTELRARTLRIFEKFPDRVSYQGTCASLDEAAQKCVEPGAPAPLVRLAWLLEVMASGVKRYSLRVNPLLPGINDSREQIHAILDWAVDHGICRVAISYMYGSKKIFKVMAERGVDVCKYFDKDTESPSVLSGGGKKYHVAAEKRRAMTEDARAYGAARGVTVSSCGCDNTDIYRTDKCGISWRSGGPNMDTPVPRTEDELRADERTKAKADEKKKKKSKR